MVVAENLPDTRRKDQKGLPFFKNIGVGSIYGLISGKWNQRNLLNFTVPKTL
jgi:hypothetical protein